MEQLEVWEMLLLGVLVAGLLFWLGPGVKHSLKNSPKGSSKDWQGLVFILGIVILFVLLLISIV